MARTKRWLAVISWVLCGLFLLVPMSVWIYINRVEYFEESTKTSMASGLILTALFIVCLVFKAFKDIDKRISGIITIGMIILLSWLLEPVINDLFWIGVCAMISYIGYIIFSKIAKDAWDYVKEYKKEKVRVEARKEAEAETLAIHL